MARTATTTARTTQTVAERIAEEFPEVVKLLPAGATVYTVLRHVSRSGMSRSIDLYVIADGEPRYITALVREALDLRDDRTHRGVKIGGTGMDMGFHLVYSLSSVLHGGNGYALNHRWL